MIKIATFLLALLMISSLFSVTVTADESLPDGAYGAINPAYRISDSPYLRLPDDMRDWPPIVPPEPREVEDMEDPSAVEIYNVATREVIRLPSNDTTQQPIKLGLNSTLTYQGLLPPGIVPESVFPPDDRARIYNTETYPWRTVCKLFMTFPDGAHGGCSGAIIGCPDDHGYHVLTAGHCVYSHDHGGWATSVKVVPGLEDDYMSYNYAWATILRSYSGWTENGDHRHDWALITIDRNVGDFTGWMGRMTADPGNSVYTGALNIAGYPGDKDCGTPGSSGLCMYFDADNGRTATEHNHWYYMDTAPGMSGSPVWVYYTNPERRYILTVHAYGDDGSGSNHGTRLNQDKFDRIITWCNSDTPPTDYADLIDDGQAYSGFSPTMVEPGVTNFNVWCDVRNVGTASSGSFFVSYYASTNTIITEYDYLIGSDSVIPISPFDWEDSDWSGTFPSSVPDGKYYVGWIIDSGEEVTEFNESNNKAYKSSYQLIVESIGPNYWRNFSPADWTTDRTPDCTVEVKDTASGLDVSTAYYNFSINSGSSWSSWYGASCTGTDGTTDYQTITASSVPFNWDSDPIDKCQINFKITDMAGNTGYSSAYIVKIDSTDPPKPIISSSTHPDEGEWYCDRSPIFTWTTPSDISGIACYSYTIDHSHWTTPDTVCDTTGNSKSYTNLDDGIWYFHVRAKDNAGNWGSADHYRVKIDTADPGDWQDFSPSDWTNDRTPDCTVEVEDDDSGLDVSTAYYKYSTDGGSTWSSWISASCTGSDGTTDYETITASSVPFNQDSSWKNKIKFKIRDMAGNMGYSSEYTVKIDATSPSASISINNGATYTNSTSVTLSLSYSDTLSGVKDCRYRNEGGSWPGWESCVGTKSWELTSVDGEKTVYYQVRDYADNIKEVSDSIILDTTPPVITIHSPLNQTYDTTSLVLNVTTDEIADVWYDLNGQGNVSLYNDDTHGTTPITVQEGANEVVVYAVDRAENVNSAVRYFEVEVVNEPPNASFTYSQSSPDVEISISQPEGVTDYGSCWGDGYWQTFKAVADTITAIDYGANGVGEMWVHIEDLNGTVLGISEHVISVSYYNFPYPPAWTHIEFASPVRVTHGETYKSSP